MGWLDRIGQWLAGDSHTSDSMGEKRHFDVEKYDERGQKDHSAGKLHISGDSHDPSMKDVHPPSDK